MVASAGDSRTAPLLKTILSRLQRTGHPDLGDRAQAGGGANESRNPNTDSDARRTLSEVSALSTRGLHSEAYRAVCETLARRPAHPELLRTRASVLYHWGRHREAIEAYRRAEAAGGLDAASWIELGWSLFFTARIADAEASMRRAVEAAPDNPSAHAGLAFTLHMQKRHAEALQGYRRGLELDPQNYECLTHQGLCLLEIGYPAQSEAMLRRAIDAAPRNPSSWTNLGIGLLGQGRDVEAQRVFEEAVRLDAASRNDAGAFINLATIFRDTTRYDQAIALFERELPSHPDGYAHLTYAFLLLLTGRMKEGWRQHEFRWFSEPLLGHRKPYPVPVWSGQELKGRTILLVAEQGMGDFVQFMRYVPLVKELGATTLLATPATGMRAFVKALPGVDRILEPGEKPPRFDYYAPLLSLPLAFGTGLDTIPAEIPYLSADPEHLRRWAPRLAPDGRLRVGLVWAGNPIHLHDAVRSMPLDALAPLWEVEGARFFSLQKGPQETQLAALGPDRPIENVGRDFADYSDTAAVIAHLDLVICVDTAVAHLAGALGQPVWLMLPHVPDWRWLVGREDTPWYPTMRLFRQDRRGDWSGVVTRVAASLNDYVNSVGSSPIVNSVGRHRAQFVPPRPRERPDANSLPGLSAVTETRFGIVQYVPDEPIIGDSIAWCGEYLQRELDLIGRIVRPGWTVVEVGAGVGLHSLFFADRLGEVGHLLVYEHRRVMRQLLKQNLAANRANNVTLMRRNLAMVDHFGNPRGDDAADRGDAKGAGTETIDDLRLERLDFLKVDDPAVAGTALEGSADTLWRLRPLLCLAARDEAALTELATRAKDFSYRCWRIESPLFNPDNFNRRENDIFAGKCALAMLAIAEEVKVEMALDECVELT